MHAHHSLSLLPLALHNLPPNHPHLRICSCRTPSCRWSHLPHVESNKEVLSLGRFSVAQYNSHRSNKHATTTHHANPLTFSCVGEAEQQVVAGIKYYLKVVAKHGKYSTAEKLFDAVMVVKPWLKSEELVSFTPSP
jgi:cystatin-C